MTTRAALLFWSICFSLLSCTAQESRQMNGFELTDLRIPADEIRQGGPPRDGIPAIDRPRLVEAGEADFLADDDRVLGVTVDGIAKAYPIRILNYHEVVNDRFGEQAVAVTYCPLCGSGLAFAAGQGEERRTFGVSGLLYNSDVLLFDRQTESLWSQILMEAVSGPASGEELTYIPTAATTWGAWRQAHPHTLALSPETGYRRDYTRSPYAGYEEQDGLMFPVARESDMLKRKDWVIGVEVDGHYKAYPLKVLAGKGPALTDTFRGRELHLRYDAESRSAIIRDRSDAEVPAVTMYWFAWYAFHPETEVFR